MITIEFLAAIIGIIIGILTLLFWVVKLCLKLNNYFDKTDNLEKKFERNGQNVNSRLTDLEKKSYLIDILFYERYPKLNKEIKKK